MRPQASLLVLLFCLAIPAASRGQSVSRVTQSASPNKHSGITALAALRRLQAEVIVYRSLGEFEADGRLAHVTLQAFEGELLKASTQLQPILAAMPAGEARAQLINALASYRDGTYWWKKVDRPRVVDVSLLGFDSNAGDPALMSTAGYTVAIHWRQAAKYLNRAQALIEDH